MAQTEKQQRPFDLDQSVLLRAPTGDEYATLRIYGDKNAFVVSIAGVSQAICRDGSLKLFPKEARALADAIEAWLGARIDTGEYSDR